MTAKTTWQSGQTPGSQPQQTNNGVIIQQPADDFDIINYMGDTQAPEGETEWLADGANEALSTSISNISDVMSADVESSHIDATAHDLNMLEEEEDIHTTDGSEENLAEGGLDSVLTDLNAIDTDLATATTEEAVDSVTAAVSDIESDAWDSSVSEDILESQSAETDTTEMQPDKTEEDIQFDDINLDEATLGSDTNVTSDADTQTVPEEHMTQDIGEISENEGEIVHDDAETEEDLEDILTEPEALDGDAESTTQTDDQSNISDTALQQTELPEIASVEEQLTSGWATPETEQTTSSPENVEQHVEETIKNDEIIGETIDVAAATTEEVGISPETQAPWTELSGVEGALHDSSIEDNEATNLTEVEGDATTQEIAATSVSDQAAVEGDPLGLWDIQLETTKRTSMFNGQQASNPDESMQVTSAQEEPSAAESETLPDIDLSAIDEFDLPAWSTTMVNTPEENSHTREESADTNEVMHSWNSLVEPMPQAEDLVETPQEQPVTLPSDGASDETASFAWAVDQITPEEKSFDESIVPEMIPEFESDGASETELSAEDQQIAQQDPTASEPIMPASNEPSSAPIHDMMELHTDPINEIDAETKSAIESKLAAVSRLSENLDTEGINLDSLIPEVRVDDIPATATPTSTGYTITDVNKKAEMPVANKKSLKIILATLWVLAAGGAMYFGYLVLEQNGLLPSIPSMSGTPTTDSTQLPANENTGSIGDQLSDSTSDLTGATEDSAVALDGLDQTQDTTATDDQFQGETPSDPDSIALDEDMTTWSEDPAPVETYVATKSRDEILTIGNLLVTRAQKLATLSATRQNASAKMEAGSIYNDAQKLLQLLENDANIDTLGKIEHDMNAVVQRFISLAQQLNGTTR